MKGHVVRFAIMVGVGDVVDGANRHRQLTDGVDNGQVDDSPEEEGDSAERRTTKSSCKALIPFNPPTPHTICYFSKNIHQQRALIIKRVLLVY